MDLHQAADPKALNAAIRAGMPFGRTSCGVTAPRSELTTDPNQVGCGMCKGANGVSASPPTAAPDAPALSADPETVSAGWKQATLPSQEPTADAPGLGSPSEFGDLDDDLDGFNPDGDDWGFNPSDIIDDAESVPGDDGLDEVLEEPAEEPDALSIVGEALGGLVSDDYEPVDVWARWMLDPSDDPDGSLLLSPNRKVDLRQFLSTEDLKFVQDLGQIASMFGAEAVASQMASMVHKLASAAQGAGAKPLWKPKKTAPKTDAKKTAEAAKAAAKKAEAEAKKTETKPDPVAPAADGGAGAEA